MMTTIPIAGAGERIVKGYPVEISYVVDGGKVETRKLLATFKLLPRSERDKLSTAEMLRQVLLDLGPIQIQNQGTVEFTPELRDQLLDDDAWMIALAGAYATAVTGGARRKN